MTAPRPTSEPTPAAAEPPATASSGVVAALLAAPGVPPALAAELAATVGERLEGLRDGAPARVVVVEEQALARPAATVELVETLRRRLLEAGWDLALGVTDLPLSVARRPVAGHASPTHGVALLSLPALGPVRTAERSSTAVARLLDEVLGEEGGEPPSAGRSRRLRRRLAGRRDVRGEDGGLVVVLTGGYLRLLAGLVWSNAPWRFAARLSRALVAALAAVTFALVTPDLWRLADVLGTPRLSALTLVSIGASAAALVVVHGLWERAARPGARAQVALFNLATATTVVLGVATLYVVLLAVTAAGAVLLLPETLLAEALGRSAGLGDYLRVSWLISSLATVGGGLGGGLETDTSVREAAFAADADDDALG
jgi:hypothetical protein